MGRFVDRTGIRYTKLVAQYVSAKVKGKTIWHCICDCGREVDIAGYMLHRGNNKSCAQCSWSTFKQVDADTYMCITQKGEEFTFSASDYDLVSQYTWALGDGRYPTTSAGLTRVSVSIMLLGRHEGLEIDHIDGNKLNNTRANLRLCTPSQNCANKGILDRNTSGTTGVSWSAKENCWRARINVGGVEIRVGTSEDIEVAKMLRKQAEEKYFGEYTRKESDVLS